MHRKQPLNAPRLALAFLIGTLPIAALFGYVTQVHLARRPPVQVVAQGAEHHLAQSAAPNAELPTLNSAKAANDILVLKEALDAATARTKAATDALAAEKAVTKASSEEVASLQATLEQARAKANASPKAEPTPMPKPQPPASAAPRVDSSSQSAAASQGCAGVNDSLVGRHSQNRWIPEMKMDYFQGCNIGDGGMSRRRMNYKTFTCATDPTCLACLAPTNVPTADRINKAWADKEKQKTRRAYYTEKFGSPEDPSPIVLLLSNEGFIPMVGNFACVGRKFKGMTNRILIIGTDDGTLNWAKKSGLASVDVTTYDVDRPKVVTSKFKWILWPVVADLLEMNYHVLFTDADAVWVKDPRPVVMNDPALCNFDVLTQFAPRWDAQGQANTGFVFIRPTWKGKTLARTLLNTVAIAMQVEDQAWFNQVLRHHKFRAIPWRPMPRSLVVDYHGPKMRKPDSLVLHVVAYPKKQRLAEAGLWWWNSTCSYFVEPAPPKA